MNQNLIIREFDKVQLPLGKHTHYKHQIRSSAFLYFNFKKLRLEVALVFHFAHHMHHCNLAHFTNSR